MCLWEALTIAVHLNVLHRRAHALNHYLSLVRVMKELTDWILFLLLMAVVVFIAIAAHSAEPVWIDPADVVDSLGRIPGVLPCSPEYLHEALQRSHKQFILALLYSNTHAARPGKVQSEYFEDLDFIRAVLRGCK